MKSGNPLVAVNAGLGSSYPVEHLMILKDAYRSHLRVGRLLYGFFDFQLTSLPETSPQDLIGNRAMLYYFEPDAVARYYHWSAADQFAFYMMRLFPAIQERGVIWEKVERLRREMSREGMPSQATNRFGNVRDFAVLEANSASLFEQECRREVTDRQQFSKPILDMLRLARQRGSRLEVVEMPMHPSHQQRFYSTAAWRSYRQYLREILHAEGASYIEAGGWIQNENSFMDNVHLNHSGAEAFSRKLAAFELERREGS
jgi:hypothetical protein